MGVVVAAIKVQRSAGGYLVQVRVKGPGGKRANAYKARVPERDLRTAIESLVADLVSWVDVPVA